MLVLDLVTQSLRDIAVISEIETPSAEQGQDAVTKLNQLMASLAEDDINFGWNPKSTTADPLVLPDGHHETIQALLSVRLCNGYGLPVPEVVGSVASEGYKRLLRRAVSNTMVTSCTDAPKGENNGRYWNIVTGTY
jgi:hypothetical protein